MTAEQISGLTQHGMSEGGTWRRMRRSSENDPGGACHNVRLLHLRPLILSIHLHSHGELASAPGLTQAVPARLCYICTGWLHAHTAGCTI